MIAELTNHLGKSAVFIEAGFACLGVMSEATADESGVTARFSADDNGFMCLLRRFIMPGEDLIQERLEDPPFGAQWEVKVSARECRIEDDLWQATFLFGGGFRVFFRDEFVKRFSAGDVTWLSEAYLEDEEDDDEGE